MRGKDDRLFRVRDFIEFLDENGALRLQPLDHIFVVYDLVADVDRRAIDAQGLLDRVDGTHHTGAEAARGAEENLQLGLARHLRIGGQGLGHR